MAPPPPPQRRSQNAADALLDGATLAARSLASAKNAKASLAKAKNNAANNPQQRAGIKRPLAGGSMRAKNGSGGTVRGSGSGLLAASLASNRNNAALLLNKNTKPKSAYERRNARDQTSKRPAPASDTDRSLLAMLDGPKKKQRKQPPSSKAAGGGGGSGGSVRSGRMPMEKRPNLNLKRGSDDIGGVILVAPPPMPSYGKPSSGRMNSNSKHDKIIQSTKPRKRISSKHFNQRRRDSVVGDKKKIAKSTSQRGRDDSVVAARTNSGLENDMGFEETFDKPSSFAETEKTTVSSALDDVVNGCKEGEESTKAQNAPNPYQKRSSSETAKNVQSQHDSIELGEPMIIAPSSQKSTTVKNTSDGDASLAAIPIAQCQAPTVAAINKKKPLRVGNNKDSMEELDATMPTDEELMALPLAIGAKRAKSKPTRGGGGGSGAFGSKSNNVRRSQRCRKGAISVGSTTKEIASLAGGDADHNASVELEQSSTAPGQKEVSMDIDDFSVNERNGVSNHMFDNDAPFHLDANNGEFNNNATAEDAKKTQQHADWYDPEEHAKMDEEAALVTGDAAESSSRKTKGRKANNNVGVNDNFVRLDLKNAAGSCRGARNLKKVNKQKLWRAQHRFGMSDRDAKVGDGGDDNQQGGSGNSSNNHYGQQGSSGKTWGKFAKKGKEAGVDLKCFASAKYAGVDPLDDFMDGVFITKEGSGEKEDASTNKSTTPSTSHAKEKNVAVEGNEKGTAPAAPTPNRRKKPAKTSPESSVPICTRHQRPCKLLTVKRNHKGNKGRKFYVCSLPRGEQCDFFKWEEDTIEATQRALLKSSSSSGFIARQVAAAKTRFKELTVPELRVENKKRGLKSTGKKDQLLTRLLIWIRDEIAGSVDDDGEPNISEPDATKENDDAITETAESNGDNSSEVSVASNANDMDKMDGTRDDDESDEESKDQTKRIAAEKAQMIELSDDGESSYDEDSGDDGDDDSCCDELEICHAPINNNNAVAPKEDSLHKSLLEYFGHTSFRQGQEWAVQRTLSSSRTLLVAPTGQGKSLCYALPAALMEGICIVVSPLISLMQDQLRQLPPRIPAATLSGSMTTSQMALIVDDMMRGRYKVLFVSPERLASAAFRRLLRPKFDVKTRTYQRQFPEVSLLCVDEAHCLSQWGHNFRPSYLRIKSLLPHIRPKSILALTATAGPMVVRDICNTLGIPYDGHSSLGVDDSRLLPPEEPFDEEFNRSNINTDGADGVKVLSCDRDNIDVFSLVLQNSDERRYLLHKILKANSNKSRTPSSEKIRKLPIEEGCLSNGSVIVYVWRQKDTEIVAEQLNAAGINGGVVCYHGGMDANDRSRAQSKFLRGKARICVATVAFGLGINKPDIVGVIHLCLPPAPEHYLQETGRAGRDGRAAKAIALPLAEEYLSRHSLAHSDRIARSQLELVFSSLQKQVNIALGDIPPESGVDLDFVDDLPVALPVKQTVDSSDCKEESIETILSLLELQGSGKHEQGSLQQPLSSLLSVEGYLPDAATITLKRRSLNKLEKMGEEIASSITKCGFRVDGDQDDNKGSDRDASTANPRHPNKYQGNFGGTAMEKGFYAYSFGTYKFSVVHCARCMGPRTEPRHVYAALRRLQSNGELELVLDTTMNGRAMHLRMKQEGIRLFRDTKKGGNGCSNNDDIREKSDSINEGVKTIIDKMTEQFSAKEKVSVGKVESIYEIMHQVSCCQENDEEGDGGSDGMSDEKEDVSSNNATCEGKKSPRLVVFQKLVQHYFEHGSINENTGDSPPKVQHNDDASVKAPDIIIKDFPLNNKRQLSYLSSNIRQLMQVLSHRPQERMPESVRIDEPEFADYRDLCLAKILHGIAAPRAPILDWYNHTLWGRYREYDFESVVLAVKKTFNE